MKFTRSLSRRAALGGLLAASAAGAADAQQWRPPRSMNWLVPFPPGGSNDLFARPVAAQVSQRFGKPVVVENRSGAGGTLGGMVVARARPDGCTLLVANSGQSFATVVYAESGFDLVRDFAPVSNIAKVPVGLVVNPAKLDVKDLAAFIAAARKAPDSINIGSSGLGTMPHLAIELLQRRTGIKLTHVPYRGGGPALQDLLAGQLDATFQPLSTVASYVQSGRLRALAVATTKRESMLPAVPTFAEAGVKDFEVSTWYGLFAPRATPAVPLDALHAAVQAALAEPEIKRIWQEQGASVDLESRQAFGDFVKAEVERWSAIARTIGLPME
ncbi:Bug family tripartite tricarboxylate transporter substrate binding protein [Reyranella sp.]|uniref:Bug family tripartite tricarboxylate transporter substrate binding protein n=1 Tax=Reyranella sp. TaxID=1929291 RepID=UPI003BAA0CE1